MAIRIPIITTFDKRGVNNALKNIDGLARQAGKAAGAIAGAAAVGIGASVNEFAKFDGALNQSLAIMGDVSDTMRGEMSDAARQVAKTTTFSAEQAAESFFFLASAGLDAEQSVAALPQVAAFAQAGMFDMATATDLATDAQSALGLTSDDTQENLANLTRVTDVFVKANTLANTSVEQLATALTTNAGNALKTVAKDVEEGAAALAVFADQGIKGERAGTLLTNTIFGLTDIMKKAPAEAEALGIEVFNAAGEMNSFADISADLTEALSSMTKEQQVATLDSLGFTKQAREGTLALLGQSEQLKDYEEALRGAGGTAQEVADNQLDTFNAKLSLLGSAVADVAIDIGSQLAPTIEKLIPVIERLLPKIGDELVKAVNDVNFEALLNGLADFIRFSADNIDKIDNLVFALAAITLTVGGFTTAIRLAIPVAAAFGVTLTTALGPIGLVGAGLGLLATMFLDASIKTNGFTENLGSNERALKRYQEQVDKSRDSAEDFGNFMETNMNIARNGQLSFLDYAEVTGKFSLETFRATNEQIRMAKNQDRLQTAQQNTKITTEDLTIEFMKNSDSVMINNDLLIANSTLQEAQQRHIQAQRAGRQAYTGTLYDQIQAVMEENKNLLLTGERFRDVGDAVQNTAGNLTYLTEQTNNQSAASLMGAEANNQLGESFVGTTAEINQATEALNRFKNATPGSPG